MDEDAAQAAISAAIARTNFQRRGLTARSVSKLIANEIAKIPASTSTLPVYIDEVVLADQGTGTENAWTDLDVAPYVPENAALLIVQFEVESTSNTDVGELYFQSDAVSLPAIIRTARVDGDEDDAQPRIVYYIPPVNLKFRYLADIDAGAPNWAIRLQGYQL